MQLIHTPVDMQQWALAQRSRGIRLGCVPTMGCLHDGHMALVQQVQTRTDQVVVTIFVNPTQFGPHEDFHRYPRPLEDDLARCRAAGVTAVFLPQPAQMYAADHSVYVVEEQLGSGLCGAARPGHFRGVCTVVAKLFNLTLPHVAIFGQKDYQQAAIIRRMVRDLDFPVEVVVAPIVREPDGLALSSRNRYLSADERQRARGLSQALRLARAAGETDATPVCQQLHHLLTTTYQLRVDYVATVDGQTLQPVTQLRPGVVIALAAFAGTTRLIDNTLLGHPTDSAQNIPEVRHD
jgi:pantoate--beta-alanine ligase